MTTSVDLDQYFKDFFQMIIPGEHRQYSIDVDYTSLSFSGDITYHGDQADLQTKFDTIDQVKENNRTSNPQAFHIDRTEEVTNSYTWETEHAISVGMKVSAKITVPFVGGIDTSISTEYSFTSTEATTVTKERSWKFTQDVTVSPHSTLTADLNIKKTTPRVPFDMTGAFTGFVSATIEEFGMGMSFPVAYVVEHNPLPNFRVEGNTVYFTTSGVFTASEGIQAVIDLREDPLEKPALVPKRWTIDVTPERQAYAPKLPPEAQP